MIDFRNFNSLIALTAYFNSEKRCKQAIIDELSAYRGLSQLGYNLIKIQHVLILL